MNTSFNTLLSYLSGFIDNKYVFSGIIILSVTAFFFYIKRKAKSGFSISNKIFIFLIGYNKKNNTELIDDIIDIEKFNFHYNTNAVSKRQISKFESWIRTYELDFRLISKLKDLLDIENLKIKKVSKLYFTIVFIGIFVPFVTLFPAVDVALTPAFLIKLEDTGWFWINKHQATEYVFANKRKPWIINTTTCTANKSNTPPKNIIKLMDEKTFNLICKSFSNEEDQKYIERKINEQQLFFSIVSIALTLLLVILCKHTMTLFFAYEARKMVLLKIKSSRNKRIYRN
ncbi:DUF6216 family protein [Enterobacter hormaechei]|uniref:DUF6216 family protein n=1 Tax=Enterobacter hormaechei TaxID=158836 RepID=UPI002859BA94|nr:DUF6216 family protein [Enterobacter hormaechei]ELD3468520.1 hypothetical protein [Enterobacter hormaechei]MED5731399.1 DUF6216 family protein [Enterobacter hormaechei]HDR1983990.1 hypothetical protein [Enterobacter hormaechei]